MRAGVPPMRKRSPTSSARRTTRASWPRQRQRLGRALERKCRDVDTWFAANWGPADPRLKTPELTWRTFTAALRGGNEQAVADTVTGIMAATVESSFKEDARDLLPAVNGVTLSRLEDSGKGTRMGYFKKPKGGEGRVEFQRTGSNWRIAELAP